MIFFCCKWCCMYELQLHPLTSWRSFESFLAVGNYESSHCKLMYRLLWENRYISLRLLIHKVYSFSIVTIPIQYKLNCSNNTHRLSYSSLRSPTWILGSIKVLAGLSCLLEIPEENLSPCLFKLKAKFNSCNCRTEVPMSFWLMSEGHSKVPEATMARDLEGSIFAAGHFLQLPFVFF